MRSRKSDLVIDTNVAVVANGKTEQADPTCILECVARLRQLRSENVLLLDNRNLILDEYRKNLHPSGQPGPGDSFFKWLFENQENPKHCRKVAITPHPDRGFEEFPVDPSLSSFDRDDRKFVAVALAGGTGPRVLNASDTDWWLFRRSLQEHGVDVDFICPELMRV